MRYKILAVLLTAFTVFAFAQQDEWYQGKPIRDIVFTGLRNVRASELEALMNPYIGRIFDDNLFWEIQGKLYALEYFDIITPSAVRADAFGNEVIIKFDVTERPVISRINFYGNSNIRRTELLEVISIKTSDVVNQSRIRVDEQAIANKYIEKGYPNVAVRSETQRSGDGNVTVGFYITEGERVTIREILFDGNTIFSSRALRGQLSLKVKNIIQDGAFQEAKLLADIQAITMYYHERGYIDAQVIDVAREIIKDEESGNNNLTLTFRIHEGRIYTFGGIAFEGNVIFSGEQLQRLINSKTGETVNERRLEADLQRVAELYFENGYIFNSIGRTENRDSAAGVLSYHVTIVERGRAHIENIIIKGNEKTRTEVILREIPLEPGDVFSRGKVMEALRNLYNLQFFSAVYPDTPQGSADSLMDLVFTVEEQMTTDIQVGLSFSGNANNSFPISGLVKWNDHNLFGTGNQLSVEFNSSVIDTTNFLVDYMHRWIFGLPLSVGVNFTVNYSKRNAAMNNSNTMFNGDEPYAYPDGFYSYEEYERNSKLSPSEYLMEYEQWYLSLGFSTGYRWLTPAGNVNVSGGLRFGMTLNSYNADLYRPFDPVLREDNNNWTPKNSFWVTAALDQRDIFYDPSKGYYFSQRFGITGFFDGENEHFIRTDTKAEYYLTLFDLPVFENWNFKAVLALHSGLSFILRQPGRGQERMWVADSSKLAVDGMFTGRGWSSEFNKKGLAMWENSVEVRIPLFYGVLAFDFFFDAAGVEAKEGEYFSNGNFTINDMRFSFGGGLRFTIAQFPLRFSLAKRFRWENNVFTWKEGVFLGMDPVISFVISY